MRQRYDGSVQSSSTPTPDNVGRREDHGLYRCMVTKVKFADDAANITTNSSSPRVLYDVVVLGGYASGQIISNCRMKSDLGGNYNFHERVLRASSKDVSKTKLADCDGDIVFVEFIQGHTGFPVITGCDQGIKTGTAMGAKKSDGPRDLSQYNGVRSLIDKNGVFTWSRRGGSFSANLGAFVPSSTDDVKVVVNDSKINLTLKSGMLVTIDGGSDTVHVKTNGGGAIKIVGNKVAIGNSTTELLQQISDQLDKLMTFATSAASHTHVGNLGFPTSPPTPATAYTTLQSDMSAIKSKIDALKGSL